MITLADINAKLDGLLTDISNAVTLLNTLKADLDAAIQSGADQTTLQAISDKMGKAASDLEAAIAADTPQTT